MIDYDQIGEMGVVTVMAIIALFSLYAIVKMLVNRFNGKDELDDLM